MYFPLPTYCTFHFPLNDFPQPNLEVLKKVRNGVLFWFERKRVQQIFWGGLCEGLECPFQCSNEMSFSGLHEVERLADGPFHGAWLRKKLSFLCLEKLDVFCCCCSDKYLRKNVTVVPVTVVQPYI